MLRSFFCRTLKSLSLLALVFCIVTLLSQQVHYSPLLFHAVWRPDDTGASILPVLGALVGVVVWMASDLIGD